MCNGQEENRKNDGGWDEWKHEFVRISVNLIKRFLFYNCSTIRFDFLQRVRNIIVLPPCYFRRTIYWKSDFWILRVELWRILLRWRSLSRHLYVQIWKARFVYSFDVGLRHLHRVLESVTPNVRFKYRVVKNRTIPLATRNAWNTKGVLRVVTCAHSGRANEMKKTYGPNECAGKTYWKVFRNRSNSQSGTEQWKYRRLIVFFVHLSHKRTQRIPPKYYIHIFTSLVIFMNVYNIYVRYVKSINNHGAKSKVCKLFPECNLILCVYFIR